MIIGVRTMTMKALIVAVDEDAGIGRGGDIPWYFAEDMKFFAKTTRGATCIMGRKTYEDILDKVGNKEQLLPKRQSIVITSLPQEEVYGAIAVKSFDEALKAVTEGSDVFFTGGESIYNECLPYIDTALVTEIPGTHECDVLIPEVITYLLEKFAMTEDTTTNGGLNFTKYERR